MQTRALVDRTLNEAHGTSQHLVGCEEAAEQAARFLQNASGVAAAIQQGLEGIWSAVDHFKATPPDVNKGLMVLGSTLLRALDLVLTEEGRESWGDYAKFRDFWTKAFEDFQSNFEGIRADLQSFAEEGNVTSLISAVSQVLVRSSDMVAGFVSEPLANTISRVLDAVNKAFAAVGEALTEFRDGDTVGGLQAIYYGLRNATQGLWGSDSNDTILVGIVASLDGIVGGISQDVLEYQRRLSESQCCWKVSLARERYLPSMCSEGYIYDGDRHCVPEDEAKCYKPAADCVMPFKYRGVTYKNCTSKHHSRPWCAHDAEYQRNRWSDCEEVPCTSLLSLDRADWWQRKPSGTVPATCDTTDTDDVEKNGGWCYKACPEGYKAFAARCWTSCEASPFPFNSPLICAESQAVLQSTVAEMVTVTLRSALSLASVLASMQALGVNAQSLTATINVFLDMGKPFALPKCSEVD
ncbi:unnamed protein product [Symbiodinium pilosum]|uniref:Fibronectin type-II domain-containing protein n=1 Tax=Symbiodinium pilosum TaxID=2952 RepID=A0A812Q7Z7_SYMPI|nr:unnamed protein product [Symbiodinium pilosum]